MSVRQIFWVNQRYITLPLITWSKFCDLYAYPQSIFLIWCKFQTITLKTVGGLAEYYKVCRMDGHTDSRTHRQVEGKTICPPSLCGRGIKIKMSAAVIQTFLLLFSWIITLWLRWEVVIFCKQDSKGTVRQRQYTWNVKFETFLRELKTLDSVRRKNADILTLPWIFGFLNPTEWRLETPKHVTGKQSRPRSDATECCIWSGSPLFADSSTIFL